MDILNLVLIDQVSLLPPYYMLLNGDFKYSKSKILDMDIDTLYNNTYAIHFSEATLGGYGKPWLSTDHHIQQESNSHPWFQNSFHIWWNAQKRLCE